ncbi:MAG: hypothetical protein NZ556_04365 [Fimbriimonadales bacterium]|nr:hypothetical protein [Fimbriimonadales bacterium]
MMQREVILRQAVQLGVGLVSLRMPVPPPAERDERSGALVALKESLARIDDAGRRFAQRLQQAHAD